MEDHLVQAYARINVHELVIEIMMANWLATMHQDAREKFMHDFKGMFRNVWIAGIPDIPDADAHQVIHDAEILAGHFAEKVLRRARGIEESLTLQKKSPEL